MIESGVFFICAGEYSLSQDAVSGSLKKWRETTDFRYRGVADDNNHRRKGIHTGRAE